MSLKTIERVSSEHFTCFATVAMRTFHMYNNKFFFVFFWKLLENTFPVQQTQVEKVLLYQ